MCENLTLFTKPEVPTHIALSSSEDRPARATVTMSRKFREMLYETCERTDRQTCWSQYFAALPGAKWLALRQQTVVMANQVSFGDGWEQGRRKVVKSEEAWRSEAWRAEAWGLKCRRGEWGSWGGKQLAPFPPAMGSGVRCKLNGGRGKAPTESDFCVF